MWKTMQYDLVRASRVVSTPALGLVAVGYDGLTDEWRAYPSDLVGHRLGLAALCGPSMESVISAARAW